LLVAAVALFTLTSNERLTLARCWHQSLSYTSQAL
jgi:hypothetical protein